MLMLVKCFENSPAFESAFPDKASRGRALRALFRAALDDALAFGHVEAAIADEIAGILLWYPPGRYPMPIWRELLGLPSYLRIAAIAPLGLMRLYRLQVALDRLRPREPHCHGYFLASRANARIGLLLGRRMLDEADAYGWPTYLETQSRRAVALYLRLGFTIANEFQTAGGPTWTMWRCKSQRRLA